MTRWIALLYSVILTPQRRVTSADLIHLAEGLGFSDPKTVLSTGNLIFAGAGTEDDLTRRIEAAIVKNWGRPIPVLLRTAADWVDLVAANPFPAESDSTPDKVAVRVMRVPPAPARMAEIARHVISGEKIMLTSRAIWIASPQQLSRSALLRAVAAPKSGTGTFRNVSAIGKIAMALD